MTQPWSEYDHESMTFIWPLVTCRCNPKKGCFWQPTNLQFDCVQRGACKNLRSMEFNGLPSNMPKYKRGNDILVMDHRGSKNVSKKCTSFSKMYLKNVPLFRWYKKIVSSKKWYKKIVSFFKFVPFQPTQFLSDSDIFCNFGYYKNHRM